MNLERLQCALSDHKYSGQFFQLAMLVYQVLYKYDRYAHRIIYYSAISSDTNRNAQ